MVKIPFSKYPSSTQQVLLDGLHYIFEYYWNSTGSYWSMSLLSRVGEPLVQGIKLVFGTDLVSRYAVPNAPPGRFVLIRDSGETYDLTEDELGVGVNVMYIGVDELETV